MHHREGRKQKRSLKLLGFILSHNVFGGVCIRAFAVDSIWAKVTPETYRSVCSYLLFVTDVFLTDTFCIYRCLVDYSERTHVIELVPVVLY